MDKRAYIRDEFSKIQIELSEKQAEQFEQYYEMLIAKNEVMNLTAITEFEEVVQKHFIDSVMIKEVREPGDKRKMDRCGELAQAFRNPFENRVPTASGDTIGFPEQESEIFTGSCRRTWTGAGRSSAWKSGRIRKESRVPGTVRLLCFPGSGKFGVAFGILPAFCEGGWSIRTL